MVGSRDQLCIHPSVCKESNNVTKVVSVVVDVVAFGVVLDVNVNVAIFVFLIY